MKTSRNVKQQVPLAGVFQFFLCFCCWCELFKAGSEFVFEAESFLEDGGLFSQVDALLSTGCRRRRRPTHVPATKEQDIPINIFKTQNSQENLKYNENTQQRFDKANAKYHWGMKQQCTVWLYSQATSEHSGVFKFDETQLCISMPKLCTLVQCTGRLNYSCSDTKLKAWQN